MRRNEKGFTLIELIIVIAILGIIALIAVPNLAGIRQRSQVSADIRTAETIGKSIRIWQTDADAANDGLLRRIPYNDGDNTTDDILYYAYYDSTGGFFKFAGIDYYVGTGYVAKSMSPEATYFISSIGQGVNDSELKILVGIDEPNADGKTPKTLVLPDPSEPRENVVTYQGGEAGWAYYER
ncbi:MAG: prepilin-type N-terminal cleavage/methylation domain-containing protein [Clostridia bacterium]|nr:prepilin-type N-terminal cleavage/methylation domain-containing protein [Clostridia bacterium]